MKRILIVEDNKALAKIISKKIQIELNFEVDIAYKLSEAKLFLKRYKYFITLLDLNLPDAPNGEVVDYTLKTENKVIVLSGNIDKKFRKSMLQKNIIDYVNKSGIDDINYIVHTINRLEKNQKHKILIVDDSMIVRKQMKDMLENLFFEVYTVAHGEEALGMLNTHSDISLVLTDYYMPVMDGLELTKEIRKTQSKNDLSIIVFSSNEDVEINAMFLKNGANDYIKKPFSKEEFSCRINNTIESIENLQIIINHSSRDFLTGLHNRKYFFDNIPKYFDNALDSTENFAIAMINIDNFKNINTNFGTNIGDKIIIKLADIIRSNIYYEDMVSRFNADEFCVVVKDIRDINGTDIFERIRSVAQSAVIISDNGEEIDFTISVSVSIKHEDNLNDTMDRIDMLLYNSKQNAQNQVVFC